MAEPAAQVRATTLIVRGLVGEDETARGHEHAADALAEGHLDVRHLLAQTATACRREGR